MLENLTDLATIVASIAALASVVWAVTVWKKQRQHDALQEFRKDLSSFRSAVQIFSENNGDLPAIEAGNYSAFRILDIAGADSGAAFKDFARSCDKTEVFIGALIFGHQKSQLFQKKIEAQLSIQRSAGRHNENFPVTNRLLMTVSSMVARTSDINGKAQILNKMIADGVFPSKLIDNVQDDIGKSTLFSVVSDHFTQIGALGAGTQGKLTNILKELTEVIISNYLNQQDEDLHKFSSHEKREIQKINLEENTTFTADVKSLTTCYQGLISSNDWTRLVELRTKLDEVYS